MLAKSAKYTIRCILVSHTRAILHHLGVTKAAHTKWYNLQIDYLLSYLSLFFGHCRIIITVQMRMI